MINVIVTNDPKYPVNKIAIQTTVIELLNKLNIKESVEVGISIVGDKKMHEINKKYRGIDTTTNILSFALENPASANLQHIPKVGFVKPMDNIIRLGDILISHPQLEADAALEGVSTDEELRFLVEHGMNHLLGIHHNN